MAPSISYHADPEETAEAFVMDRMTPGEKAAYLLHLDDCESCSMVVEEQRVFIEAMRAAMRDLANKSGRNARNRAAQK
jgi:hypothetical protein